jgi:hypothetical protein
VAYSIVNPSAASGFPHVALPDPVQEAWDQLTPEEQADLLHEAEEFGANAGWGMAADPVATLRDAVTLLRSEGGPASAAFMRAAFAQEPPAGGYAASFAAAIRATEALRAGVDDTARYMGALADLATAGGPELRSVPDEPPARVCMAHEAYQCRVCWTSG